MLSIYREHRDVVDLSRTSPCCWFIKNVSIMLIYRGLNDIDLSRICQCCRFIENISVFPFSRTSQCCRLIKLISMLSIYQEHLNVVNISRTSQCLATNMPIVPVILAPIVWSLDSWNKMKGSELGLAHNLLGGSQTNRDL